MLIGLIGGTQDEHLAIINEMRNQELISVVHCNLLPLTASARNQALTAALHSRKSGSRVIVVSGVNSQVEYEKLLSYRALITLVNGPISRIFGALANPIHSSFCYVASSKSNISQFKRARYLTPLELISECHMRYHNIRRRTQ